MSDTIYFYTQIFPPFRDVAHPTVRFRGPLGWCTHIFFLAETWDALLRVFWVLLGRSTEASKGVIKSRKITFPAEYINEARWLAS